VAAIKKFDTVSSKHSKHSYHLDEVVEASEDSDSESMGPVMLAIKNLSLNSCTEGIARTSMATEATETDRELARVNTVDGVVLQVRSVKLHSDKMQIY